MIMFDVRKASYFLDNDPESAVFLSNRLSESRDVVLGGGVDGEIGDGHEAGHGGDVDDGTLAPLGHVGEEGVTEHRQGQHVHCDDFLTRSPSVY